MGWPYAFEANKQATKNNLDMQLAKVREELIELSAARYSGDKNAMCREAWDVIQATEGILRKFDILTVVRAKNDVIERCFTRGDYDTEGQA